MKIKLSFIFFFLTAVTSGYAQKYHDAAAFGLKGPVKSFVNTEFLASGTIWEDALGPYMVSSASFDQDGKCTQFRQIGNYTIENAVHDKNGMLISYEVNKKNGDVYKYSIEYDETNLKLTRNQHIYYADKKKYSYPEQECIDIFSYNSDGITFKKNYKYRFVNVDKYKESKEEIYFVLRTDQYGNPTLIRLFDDDGNPRYDIKKNITYWPTAAPAAKAQTSTTTATTTVNPSSTNTTAVKPSTTSTTSAAATNDAELTTVTFKQMVTQMQTNAKQYQNYRIDLVSSDPSGSFTYNFFNRSQDDTGIIMFQLVADAEAMGIKLKHYKDKKEEGYNGSYNGYTINIHSIKGANGGLYNDVVLKVKPAGAIF